MKIEIDLSDLFCEGEEPCDLQEAIRHEVITNLTHTLKEGIGKQVQAEVSKVINDELAKAVQEQMPALIQDLMNAEYIPVDRWGDRKSGTTTFRTELVKSIHEQMVYKKTTYSSDANAFTRAVDETVSGALKGFQSEFNKKVDADFTAAAFEYARNKLAEKLRIK